MMVAVMRGLGDDQRYPLELPDHVRPNMTEAKPESWICMFMDAMPFNLEFEVNDLRIIEMLPRHCGFHLSMNEAAETLLGIGPPYDFEAINPKIDKMLERLRNGKEVKCDQTFPAATLGVLWSWQLVIKHEWNWCAVNQNWWETIGVCDPSKRCVILPVQYFRRLVGETGEIGARDDRSIDKWPRDLLLEINNGQLPIDPQKSITFVY